jgi:hypothetical protein
MPNKTAILLLILFSATITSSAQDSSNSLFNRIVSFPDKVFSGIDKQSQKLQEQLNRRTDRLLNKLERQEEQLKRQLWKTDSLKAKELFGDVKGRYEQLRADLQKNQQLATTAGTYYSGHLDSLGTAFRFLQQNPVLQQGSAIAEKLQANAGSITQLQQKLNAGEFLRRQIEERQQQLKQQLANTPLLKEFRKFRQEVANYQTQLREVKELVNDPKKLGAAVLTTARKIPAFQKFFSRYSELASLFPPPPMDAAGNPIASFAGLQTRAQVNQLLEQRLGGTGVNPQQLLQQNIGVAQNYLSQLKDRMRNMSGTITDADMSDFTPDQVKGQSFKKRLELNTNIQSSRGRSYMPSNSELALNLGYKLNEKSVIGFGGSYRVGWGNGWDNIRITHQGVGLRSFLDWKLKGNLWISGGYEQNYYAQFRRVQELKNFSAWKASALLGVTKSIDVKSKFFKKTKLQLLYDFLWRTRVPVTETVKFRIGYNF